MDKFIIPSKTLLSNDYEYIMENKSSLPLLICIGDRYKKIKRLGDKLKRHLWMFIHPNFTLVFNAPSPREGYYEFGKMNQKMFSLSDIYANDDNSLKFVEGLDASDSIDVLKLKLVFFNLKLTHPLELKEMEWVRENIDMKPESVEISQTINRRNLKIDIKWGGEIPNRRIFLPSDQYIIDELVRYIRDNGLSDELHCSEGCCHGLSRRDREEDRD